MNSHLNPSLMFVNKGVVCTYTINYVPCYNRKYHNRIEVHYCGKCRKLFSSTFWLLLRHKHNFFWRYNIQHGDIQHNNTRHNNERRINDYWCWILRHLGWMLHFLTVRLNVVILSVALLSVVASFFWAFKWSQDCTLCQKNLIKNCRQRRCTLTFELKN